MSLEIPSHFKHNADLQTYNHIFKLHVIKATVMSTVYLPELFSARCNKYISRLCYDVSVRLSVCL